MPPAARIGDMHTCPMVDPGPKPHVGGPIIQGETSVVIGYMPAARVMDQATCAGPPDAIAKGSTTVLIGYMMAARMGDSTLHGGVITKGEPTVLIGDAGGGGGGGAAGGGGGGSGGGGGGGGESPAEAAPADPASSVVASQNSAAAQSGAAFCEVCSEQSRPHTTSEDASRTSEPPDRPVGEEQSVATAPQQSPPP